MTAIITRNSPFQLEITWEPLPEDYPIPDDPVEDTEHPLIAEALKNPIYQVPELRQQAFMASHFALYAKVNNRTICQGPDWMYVSPVSRDFACGYHRSYTPHAEGPIPLLYPPKSPLERGTCRPTDSPLRKGGWGDFIGCRYFRISYHPSKNLPISVSVFYF